MKTTSVWVVALAGEHVFHGHSVQGVIETIDDLRIIREKIKEAYKIEFELENSARDEFKYFYQKYENITDDRDIMLILERVSMYQNDDLKEQFKELAQYYFGRTMAGLNCKPCDYTTFKKWYDDNHTCEATYEIYLVAQWVWYHYEPNF
jgi:hypothetical protein